MAFPGCVEAIRNHGTPEGRVPYEIGIGARSDPVDGIAEMPRRSPYLSATVWCPQNYAVNSCSSALRASRLSPKISRLSNWSWSVTRLAA